MQMYVNNKLNIIWIMHDIVYSYTFHLWWQCNNQLVKNLSLKSVFKGEDILKIGHIICQSCLQMSGPSFFDTQCSW